MRFVCCLIVAVAILFFLNNSHHKNVQIPSSDATITSGIPHSSSTPLTLLIPSIGLQTHIQSVGITFKGNMGVPSNYSDVGWYKLGPKPGDKGNAVIDGHLDNGWGIAAIFKNLDKLKIGDKIYVIDEDGATTTFRVIKTAVYPYDNAPIASIFGPTDDHNLNLITCAGTWIQKAATDDKRLVVFTQKIVN